MRKPALLFVALVSLAAAAARAQEVPVLEAAAATDGERIGVAWAGDDQAIHASLILAATQRLDASVVIGSGVAPAIAYGSGVYFIIWRNGNELMLRRYRPNGDEVDSAPISIASEVAVRSVAIAANDRGAIAAWFSSDLSLHSIAIPPTGPAAQPTRSTRAASHRTVFTSPGAAPAFSLLGTTRPSPAAAASIPPRPTASSSTSKATRSPPPSTFRSAPTPSPAAATPSSC